MSDIFLKRTISDDDWKKKLSSEEYNVLRRKGTEVPFSGKYVDHHENGAYYCKACGQQLFNSTTKFDSGTGWPSFTEPIFEHVTLQEDTSHNMNRIEVQCAACNSHLGHVFPDGPKDKGGMRYCINSISLDFKSKQNRSTP